MLKEKSMKLVVAFHTATEAMAAEKYFGEHRIRGRLIPTPRIISADCGMCWSAPIEAADEVEKSLKEGGLGFEKIYRMLL